MNRHRPIGMARVVITAVVMAAGFGIMCLVDRPVFRALDWPWAEREDWHRMLRVMGFVPLWIVAGLAVGLLTRNRDGFHRRSSPAALGMFVALAPLIAGLVAEPLKLVFRRERPDASNLRYVFRSWDTETFSTSGLGLPSSHAMVAFAGATALCMVAPRAGLVWVLLALGCGFTRVADRAHWASDVFAAAAFGFVTAWLLGRIMGVRSGGGSA
ncbi:MAG: phosphatase PAP2 family protein [Phycisphaerae bacterium]|nr:phosphatase PAP2 family protein [Phycisphaerae bacterium]